MHAASYEILVCIGDDTLTNNDFSCYSALTDHSYATKVPVTEFKSTISNRNKSNMYCLPLVTSWNL